MHLNNKLGKILHGQDLTLKVDVKYGNASEKGMLKE
jgi:hypothetical protein